MYLALGVLLAAVSLGEIVRAALHHYELPIDRVGNVVSLGFVVLLPLVLLYLEGLRRTAAGRQAEAARGG